MPATTTLNKTNEGKMPYGVNDLDPAVNYQPGPPRRVRCYVRGCTNVLTVPTRGQRGEVCPEHGIRCHYSSSGPTFVYQDVRRNIIASADMFAKWIVGHPFKYESHRLGAERSEDALSWNVFRSLQEAGCLHVLAHAITGDSCPIEPYLYLWGICLTDNAFDPWPLLVMARRRFEANLPVNRPLTEPDIALHLPGRYLILIEAKFTSPNGYYNRGPRRDGGSLTLDELLGIYRDPGLQILDHRRADQAERVPYQLWRNTVFAEWMARADHPGTRAFHVNLVREENETVSADEFRSLLNPAFEDRFQRWSWEGVSQTMSIRPKSLT